MKITLKNNEQITLKRIRAKDYDAMMIYLDKFTKGPSAKWTNQYPNQPKKDKQKSIEAESADKINESDDKPPINFELEEQEQLIKEQLWQKYIYNFNLLLK